MKKNYIARRRGTSVAAAALSFALVAPFAQPVAFAQQDAPAAVPVAFAQDAGVDPNHVYIGGDGNPGVTQPTLDSGETDGAGMDIYDVDAIASGQIDNANRFAATTTVAENVVSGRAMIVNPIRGGQLTATYDAFEPIPDGQKVYFQWVDNDGAVSPIYSAVTHELPGAAGTGGRGMYAFAVPQWTDAKGKVHEFRTLTSQKYRVWTEAATSKDGNELVPLRSAPGMIPRAYDKGSGSGMGEFPGEVGTNGNMQRTATWNFEIPADKYMLAPEGKRIVDDRGPISNPGAHYDRTSKRTVSGNVWLETGNERQLFTGASPAFDPKAQGYTVYATWLTPEGEQANEAIKAANKEERVALTKQMLAEHPEYVAGTVSAKTDENGDYTLRFPEDQYSEDRSNPQENMYMWVEDPAGNQIPTYTGGYTQPVFQYPAFNPQWAPTSVPVRNNAGLVGAEFNRMNNVNFAAVPYYTVKLDITNFDNVANPAMPGDVAEVELKGDLPATGGVLEWRDGSGKVLKKCEISGTTKDDLGECATFDVPDDAADGSYYWAVVTNGENDLSADSFIVLVDGSNARNYDPSYEDKLVVPGEETKSSPTFTDKDGKDVTAPEGSKFKITDGFTAPEGYDVKIDENTGEITVTFPDESKLNEDTVEEFDVPVTVTYPDRSIDKTDANFKLDTDGDGTSDLEDDDDDNDGVTDEKEEEDGTNPKVPNQNTIFDPAYEDKLVVPGEETKSSPTFTDKDGKDVTAPEGSKFKITDGFTAPEGYDVKIDENTGEITVTFPDESKLNKDTVEEFDVPVTVTYPDQTTDKTDANFKLDTDGDGTSDLEDDDDDNDGIPDGEDSNPKVPNQDTIYEPGYEDGSGKPGSDVKIDPPTFTDK
ncbi:YPDG domain-containing protein, partial [Corynebacterium sp. MSK008]|uniref:YPDG domain-containing protein n=1 Tax=Corynebacterium sp. MSK008 TaxID=3050188 RepID=UPI00254CEBB8